MTEDGDRDGWAVMGRRVKQFGEVVDKWKRKELEDQSGREGMRGELRRETGNSVIAASGHLSGLHPLCPHPGQFAG